MLSGYIDEIQWLEYNEIWYTVLKNLQVDDWSILFINGFGAGFSEKER